MGREPLLSIVVGRKGVGKTVTTMKFIRQYVTGGPSTPARKVLIFDTNNEFSDKSKYPDIKLLHLRDVLRFAAHPKIEIRRVHPFMDSGDEMTPDQKAMAVDYILKNFRNGLVLLEDINSYIGDYMPTDVVGVILSQRHKGIDTILHYHSFGRVQKKIWPHVNMIRMHRANDSVDNNVTKFPEKAEVFSLAEIIVKNQFDSGNIYFYLHINNDREKIYAKITDEEKEKAVSEFIASGCSRIKRYLEMRNENGGKVYAYGAALAEEKKRIMSTYF